MFLGHCLNIHWIIVSWSLDVCWNFFSSLCDYWIVGRSMLVSCSLDVGCSLEAPWMLVACSLDFHWMFVGWVSDVRWMFIGLHWMLFI